MARISKAQRRLIESASQLAHLTSPACGGGRRARRARRVGETLSPRPVHLQKHPHPSPPPQAGEGADFRRCYRLDLISSDPKLACAKPVVCPRLERDEIR